MRELDPRILKVTIEVNGKLKTYSDVYISASGIKYANANQDECEVRILNLDKATRNYILTETSPLNYYRRPKLIRVEAGRQSYGTFLVFSGDVVSSNLVQPPDIGVTLRCLTLNFLKTSVVSRSQAGAANLSLISKEVAKDLNVALNFQADEKTITNYAYTGAALKQVDKLNQFGVNAYLDNDTLVVKNVNAPLRNRVKIVSVDTGMIGYPEITEEGIRVKFLLDNQTVVGGSLRLISKVNPAVNGDYIIYKLSFEIANRDVPFYWIAEARRPWPMQIPH